MEVVSLLYALAFVTVCCAAPTPTPLQEPFNQNPELIAGYFEGDIVIDESRNVLRNESLRWPNNIVYYYINDHFNKSQHELISEGMHNIEAVSCIRFKEATPDQKYYVNITGQFDGCFATPGYSHRVQSYNLAENCFRIGIIMHEFLHTLGFFHMQSASDRDEYVRIVTENIREGREHNFKKYDEDFVNDFDIPYDYGSVMHYPRDAFSSNGKDTIIPLKELPPGITMGQRDTLSESDIKKLNLMYECNEVE